MYCFLPCSLLSFPFSGTLTFMLNTFKLLCMQKMNVMFMLLDLPGKWGIDLPQILFTGYLPEKVEQSPIGIVI
jgi:hypothetical protein